MFFDLKKKFSKSLPLVIPLNFHVTRSYSIYLHHGHQEVELMTRCYRKTIAKAFMPVIIDTFFPILWSVVYYEDYISLTNMFFVDV